MAKAELLPIERVEQKIILLRGEKVLLHSDLAKLYGVPTKDLNKAVSRNRDRFPDDCMFQLTPEEFQSLRSPPPEPKKPPIGFYGESRRGSVTSKYVNT